MARTLKTNVHIHPEGRSVVLTAGTKESDVPAEYSELVKGDHLWDGEADTSKASAQEDEGKTATSDKKKSDK